MNNEVINDEKGAACSGGWHFFSGEAFGVVGTRTGEVVFNTSITGYQEVLTDPSYHGQIVVMTQPHIGNYGANPEEDESVRAWVAGFVVRAASPVASNWRATMTLEEYLTARNVVGMTEVDTRHSCATVECGRRFQANAPIQNVY